MLDSSITDLESLAEQLGQLLKTNKQYLVTAESCTGGWVAEVITAIAGSSEWFERGYVTYSNLAKQECLGVQQQTLLEHGAVSEQTVREMAAGALTHSQAQVSIAVSGVAGPSGGSADKPVGCVWFAWAVAGTGVWSSRQLFAGDRQAVRAQAVAFALGELLRLLQSAGCENQS